MAINDMIEVHPESCYCGKCNKRRQTRTNVTVFPYSKDMQSSYISSFIKQKIENSPILYNKSKHSNFDNEYKEHLTSGLISTHKNDYKPLKIESYIAKKEEVKTFIPFIGSSSYQNAYLNWPITQIKKQNKIENLDFTIPLRGDSNYKEAFSQYNELNYKRYIADKPASCIELSGAKLNCQTNNRDDYKSSDIGLIQHYLGKRYDKNLIEKSSFDNKKGVPNFKSSYMYDFTANK